MPPFTQKGQMTVCLLEGQPPPFLLSPHISGTDSSSTWARTNKPFTRRSEGTACLSPCWISSKEMTSTTVWTSTCCPPPQSAMLADNLLQRAFGTLCLTLLSNWNCEYEQIQYIIVKGEKPCLYDWMTWWAGTQQQMVEHRETQDGVSC